MTTAEEPLPETSALRVLAAVTDAAVLRTIERACSAEHHSFLFATDVAEAIATGTAEQPDLAFVDVTLDGGAGLALVHHLPAVCSRASVYAIVPPRRMELGSQAMALGAAGILMAPPSGDGLLLAISEVRTRRAVSAERASMRAELAGWKRRAELLESVAQLGGEPDRSRAALVIAEALAELAHASGVAVYGVTGDGPEDQVRWAAVGSATMQSDKAGAADGVRLVPLTLGSRRVGVLLFDHASALDAGGVSALEQLAAAVLGSWAPSPSTQPGTLATSEKPRVARVYSMGHFQDAATREIERARRHSRRLAIAALLTPPPHELLEELISGVVRESDVLGKGTNGEYFLLLPETGALGAHACRRRVLRLAAAPDELGDRRAPSPALGLGPTSLRPLIQPKFTVGVATYPHDGDTLESLSSRAHRRAAQAAHSMVHVHALAARPLGEIVDSLLDAPLREASVAGPAFSRAEVTVAAAHAMVGAACREALRGGGATLLVAFRPETGTLAIVKSIADDPSVVIHAIDATHLAASGGAEAVILVAEHGTWAYCARRSGDRVLAAHSADPLLADVLADRLARASGVKLS
jgi:ActR/RegA family two-component response regulator